MVQITPRVAGADAYRKLSAIMACMPLRSVAVVLPDEPAIFELGLLCEVFGIDRTADGIPPIDFRVCASGPAPSCRCATGWPWPRPSASTRSTGPTWWPSRPPRPEFPGALLERCARPTPPAPPADVCSGSRSWPQPGCWTAAVRLSLVPRRGLRQPLPQGALDSDVLFVDDGDIVTSGGPRPASTPAHLVRRELGAEVATRIARRMVVPPQRDGGQRQFIDLRSRRPPRTASPRCLPGWRSISTRSSRCVTWPAGPRCPNAPLPGASSPRPAPRRPNGLPATAAPRPAAARGDRPGHRVGGDAQRLRQRGAASPPLRPGGRHTARRLPPRVRPQRRPS